MEKKGLSEQIKELEARVATLENINNDLLNRNRMLEYSLRQMKYTWVYLEDKKARVSHNRFQMR